MKTSNKLLSVPVLMLVASAAFADPAAVADDFGCFGFVPDGAGGSLGGLYTTETHSVVTHKGVTSVTCRFDHNFDLPQAYGTNGFVCGTFAGVTNDTMMLATPGGKAILKCKINGGS
jgi:hypothetical protein